MVEESKNNVEVVDGDAALSTEINRLPLEERTQQIANDIVETDDPEKLKELIDMFNVAQTKKNTLRVIKLTNLMDKVEDQAIERFEKHPDEVSHKDLLGYMQIVQNQIDKANSSINQVDQKPFIQVNNNKQELNVNVNGADLDRDSKDNVRAAVTALLQLAKSQADGGKNVDSGEHNDYNVEER